MCLYSDNTKEDHSPLNRHCSTKAGDKSYKTIDHTDANMPHSTSQDHISGRSKSNTGQPQTSGKKQHQCQVCERCFDRSGTNSVTCVHIQVKNHISVKYVKNALPSHRTLTITCVFIPERNRISAKYVISSLLNHRTLKITCVFIPERNHISAKYVIYAFPSLIT